MERVRLLRGLIPLLILVAVVGVALNLRSRPVPKGLPADVSKEKGARAEGFRFSDLVGGKRRLHVQARLGRMDDKGAFEVEEVERVEVDREGQAPLVLTAVRGAGSGPQGKRVMRLEGGVTIHDDASGLDVEIPTVEIDQVSGVVRSLGPVTIAGPVWKGGASAAVYSLVDRPAELTGLEVSSVDGAHLQAQRAVIPAGSRSMTLEGDVDAHQAGVTVRAPLVELVRNAQGGIASVTASTSVQGSIASTGAAGGAGAFVATRALALWGDDGKVSSVSLSGGARIEHARGVVVADTIDARASGSSPGYDLAASGQVHVSGPTRKGLGRLSSDTLRARIDGAGNIRDGLASGNVAFASDDSSGEAAEATFTALEGDGSATLKSSASRRARLASARTRIVADTITSDLRGVKLTAEGRVESTLLPAASGKSGASSAMFSPSEAVHFVSTSLESTNSGARLRFRGDVRGWQGDRTLSADDVEMIQDGEILNANGHVATRWPRVETRAASEADFVQVVSERLSYRGSARAAEYAGSVRVRQAEGWLESPHLTARLAESGHGVREVQAQDGVKFEYRAPGDNGVPTTATGDGDRAVYDTQERVLRLFGDKGPATIRNTGANGGTTVGRVLRYHLDTGSLEVESGQRDRATIKTPK